MEGGAGAGGGDGGVFHACRAQQSCRWFDDLVELKYAATLLVVEHSPIHVERPRRIRLDRRFGCLVSLDVCVDRAPPRITGGIALRPRRCYPAYRRLAFVCGWGGSAI